MNNLAGLPLDYLIGASSPKGTPGRITEVPYDHNTLPEGIGVGYCNMFDENNTGRFGPYLPPNDTSEDYNEPIPDPAGPGFELNLREQFTRRKASGFEYIELDNMDAFSLEAVLKAIALAETFGLKVIAKNRDDAQLLLHPNVAGMIIEKGTARPLTVLKDFSVWFVSFGDGRPWAEQIAGKIKATPYYNMGVTYSPEGEYGSSVDILLPIKKDVPMADWRVAHSLDTLLAQVNEKWPGRSKANDGTIGDEAHQNSTSDHNPNSAGVVTARDITHDPAHGFDSYAFADTLMKNKDERIKYVISNSRIGYGPRSPSHGGNPSSLWKWESYSGANPHDEHVHISVGDPRYYDKTDQWNIGTAVPVPPSTPDVERPILKRGSSGEDVKTVQRIIFVDGEYGPTTEQGVKTFQKAHGLQVTGTVDLTTWAALLGTAGGVVPNTGGWQMGITTTVFGGGDDPQTSAYDGHLISDTEKVASVPGRLTGSRLLDVRNQAGKIETVSVEDVGPWLTDDFYWQTGTRPIAEDMTKPITRGPNKGRYSNGAGFDISPALAKSLGIDGKGKIDWRFHVLEKKNEIVKEADVAISVVEVKPAIESKINWTQFAGIAASILTILTSGKLNISPETMVQIILAIQALQAVVTAVLKTYYTTTITPSSAAKV